MANFNTPQTPTAQLETRVEQVAQAEKLALNSLAQAERFGILAVAAGEGDVSTQERLGGNPLMTAEVWFRREFRCLRPHSVFSAKTLKKLKVKYKRQL